MQEWLDENGEERLCDCGDCKYCNAYLSSDYDYDDEAPIRHED